MTFPPPDNKILCEWTAKVPANKYDLYIVPKAKGKKFDPIKVTSNFILEEPQSIVLTPNSGGEGTSVTVTGKYFANNPKVYFEFDIEKNGKTKTVRKACKTEKNKYSDCRGKPSCMKHETGDSEFRIFVPKGITKDTKCRLFIDSGFIRMYADFNSGGGDTYTISGTVSGDVQAGVTVTLSGAASATTTTAENGTYSFANLANGTYTVTPSKTGYTFNPSSRSVTINNADSTGNDFVATASGENSPPIAYSQSVTVTKDTQKIITMTGYDPDGDDIILVQTTTSLSMKRI